MTASAASYIAQLWAKFGTVGMILAAGISHSTDERSFFCDGANGVNKLLHTRLAVDARE